jgi:hypothetical protein
LPGAATFYSSSAGEVVLLASVAIVASGYWWMTYIGRVSGTERVGS